MNYDAEKIAFKGQLKKLIGEESVSSFARKCEMGESLIRQYLSGSLPRLDKMLQISATNNVNLEWLATGRGPMRPGQIDPDKVNHLEDPIISELRFYLRDLVGEDPDRIGWFRVELTEKLPGFKEWREKNRNDPSIENSATG